MKKKTNNNRLPVPGKVKKGFRYYVALVLTIALSGSLAMSAFAAGSDPLTVVNNSTTLSSAWLGPLVSSFLGGASSRLASPSRAMTPASALTVS